MINSKNQKYIGTIALSIVQAMKKIDENQHGVLVIVDDKAELRGTLTDGDIRRFLLSGGKLERPCVDASNKNPKVAHSISEAETLYHEKNYVAVPIIDEKGTVVDIYVGEKIRRTQQKLNIPVVINAGGKGTRLEPFTKILPKPLIPVGDLPILEHIMKLFSEYGCTEFHVIVNYKKQLMKAYFAESEKSYNVTWYDEDTPLGTGGGLTLLRGRLKSTFFFTNCDTLIDTSYDSLLKFHQNNKNSITMVCAHKNLTIPYGVINMGENGKIDSFSEKPLMSFLTNTGMYLVEPEVIDDMVDGVSIGFPDVVDQQRQKGRNVAVFPVSEYDWMDMGQLSELEKMRIRLYGE